ncbi:MAG: hypothetical protein MUE72_12465 [Chitinophagaceae bacterium]|nr:hypothetical protein [Chitinophagaceae bacterium]
MNRAKYLSRLGADLAVVSLCFIAARLIFPNGEPFATKRNLLFFTYVISFWYFASQITFLYSEFLTRSLSQEIIKLVKTIIFQNVFIIVALFFLSRSPLQSKWFVIGFILMQLAFLPFIKYLSRWYYASVLNRGKKITSLLVVGAGELGMSFNSIVSNNYHLGYKIAGFVDDTPKPTLNGQYLGKIEALDRIHVWYPPFSVFTLNST